MIVADKFAADAATQTVSVDDIPEGWMGLDIGPSRSSRSRLSSPSASPSSGTAPWACSRWRRSTRAPSACADTLASLDAITIIGGGDSVAAVEKAAGLADKMSHISTGGGASLELLEGKVLPGVDALDEA